MITRLTNLEFVDIASKILRKIDTVARIIEPVI